jgi:AcrR family transcriptional regulator
LRAFADRGYDGVGLREIAQGAGVTAMLVNHYFGSKEQLFSEVVAHAVATPIILNQENIASGKPAEALATALVKMTSAAENPQDGFLLFLHSASTRRAAEITREQIETHQYKLLASVMRGPHAARARWTRTGDCRRRPDHAADDRRFTARQGGSQGSGESSRADPAAADQSDGERGEAPVGRSNGLRGRLLEPD